MKIKEWRSAIGVLRTNRQSELENRAPEGRGRAHKRPSWASTIDRLIDNPIPMPCDLVVKNGSKILPAASASNPKPQSSTVTTTAEFSWRELMISSLGPPATPAIASMPFIMRLSTTCCN